jgi:hypothetical protein
VSEKKQVGGLSVGGSSILVIFVVLSLTIFAALSFMSARADLRLAEKQAQAAREYYAADSAATERLAALDARLRLPAAEAADVSGMAGLTVERVSPAVFTATFEETMNERQVLRVTLRIPGEETATGRERWRIAAWQIVNIREWEGGRNTIEVWRPE